MQMRLYCEEVLRAQGLRTVAKGNVIVSCSPICSCSLPPHCDCIYSSSQMLNCEANCTFPSLFSFKQLAIVLARAVATSGRKQGLVYIICLTAAAKKTLLQGGGGIPASFYLQHMQVQVPASQHLSTAHTSDIL